MGVVGRIGRGSLAVLACLVAFAGPAQAAKVRSGALAAVIHRTEHGIPHVVADDDAGIGFGYGYAVAQDNICPLADSYMTVRGERSRYLGPDGEFIFYANGATHSNLDSDLFYRQLNADDTVERLLATPPPVGVKPEVRNLIRGYVAGYNRYLADTGVEHLPDPTCRGKPWVTPISEMDAYAQFAQLASLAGGGLAITGVAEAQPPTPGAPGGSVLGRGDRSDSPFSGRGDRTRSDQLDTLGERLGLGGLGSNAIALGADATASGTGMVLGNPHLPWYGGYRLYNAHLTIPGELDAAGATFIGVPLVLIGHTRKLAWSHTTSAAFRFTPFELKLAPDDPTTYLVDGEPRKMSSRTITVPVLRPDGSEGEVSRTLYSTEYGSVLTELLALPLFPWTNESAYAFGDANADNLRYLNHFYDVDRAQSIDGLDAALRIHQGLPWANTVAADSTGRTLYADAAVVPNVPDAKAADCNTALGRAAFEQLRLPVLDGSRSACAWDTDPDSVVPGIFGAGNLPFLRRTDYVTNSNDSYWLTNPAEPLEGFARIIGDERSERSLRTRLALRMVRERLAGTDDRAGTLFTLDQLQDIQFDDRQGAAELMRDALVSMCRSLPVLPSSEGPPVEKGDACEVLARWDARDRAESRGALLFRRFGEHAFKPPAPGANAVGGGPPAAGTWSDAFDPARPVDTPNQLNVASPKVQASLGDAVRDLRDSGIPLDAPLGDWQYDERGGTRIPMHGGPGKVGTFNALNVEWEPGKGYPDIPHGATFIMAAEMQGRCPPVRTLVAYSQSANPVSPFHADQTQMFSRREWVTERYCAKDVIGSPALNTRRLGCLPRRAGAGVPGIAYTRPRLRGKAVLRRLGRPDRRTRRALRWCVAGGGTVRVVLAGKGVRRVAFVMSDSRGRHRVLGLRKGAILRPKRAWRRVDRNLRVRKLGKRGYAVASVRRRGRIRWVGLADRKTGRSKRRLLRAVRAASRVGPNRG